MKLVTDKAGVNVGLFAMNKAATDTAEAKIHKL